LILSKGWTNDQFLEKVGHIMDFKCWWDNCGKGTIVVVGQTLVAKKSVVQYGPCKNYLMITLTDENV
jgi:hypothetical protein